MNTIGKNQERPCEHVLKAWIQKPIHERDALLVSCDGMDELFRDLGGDDCTTDYYAFLFFAEWVGGNIKPRHISQAYMYAELWSKWDLENEEFTSEMSSYDSFYYYMDNELYATQNINS
jgi:hypothetical protein